MPPLNQKPRLLWLQQRHTAGYERVRGGGKGGNTEGAGTGITQAASTTSARGLRRE